MSRFFIDTGDRVIRLKQRLGGPSKRWRLRIKIGGWLSLTPPMLRSLRLSAGDVIEWNLTLRGLELQRKPDKTGSPPSRLRRTRRLEENETVVYSSRPSCRRHYLGRIQSAGLMTNNAAVRNIAPISSRGHTGVVFRGSTMRFRRKPRTVSVKPFAMNLEKLIDEVGLGRVVVRRLVPIDSGIETSDV